MAIPISFTKEYKLRWYHAHKEQAAEYRRKNRETLRAKAREYYRSLPVEKRRSYLKSWYAKNRERQLAKNLENQRRNRDAANIRFKRFALRHPERVAENQAKRRARVMGAIVGDSRSILRWKERVKSSPVFICYYCSVAHSICELHIDHVIPLAKGGKHSLENLATSCADCNFSKNAKLPHQWGRIGQQFLSL